MTRVALIHATALAVLPIASAFERLWPEAQLQNILDDSLSLDRARDGQLTPAMDDLNHGHADLHHQKIATVVGKLPACDVILLAQFSMAAAGPLAQRQTATPVLSSPDCAVLALRQRMINV